MIKNFKTNTQISEPTDPSLFNEQRSLNGFSWDEDQGMFIPVQEEFNYFDDPIVNSMVRKL